MVKSVLSVLVLLVCGIGAAFGQTVTSQADGPWNDPATWDMGFVPTAANSTSIIIQNTVNVPTGASLTVDQVFVDNGGLILIDAGGTLTIANDGTAAADLNILNDQDNAFFGFLIVDGSLICNNQALITGADSGNTVFEAGGSYTHLYTTTEGSIPLASWDPASTLNVQGYTGNITASAGGNWNQSFGNVNINLALPAARTVTFSGLLTIIQGNLTVGGSAGNGASIRLSQTQSTNITIGGDLLVSGTQAFYLGTSGTINVSVGRDFSVTSTNSLTGTNFATTATTTLTVARDFSMNAVGGKITLATTGSGIMNLTGNFTLTNGVLATGSGSPLSAVNFVGTSSTQTLVNTGATNISGPINFTVSALSTLKIAGTNFIGGTNATTTSVTVSGVLQVGSVDTNGAIQTGLTAGNIRVGGARQFNSGSTVTYNGSAGQFIGNGHPTTIGVNTIIDNLAGVSLIVGVPVIITTNLTLTHGDLNIGDGALTLSGNLSAALGTHITINTLGSITIDGSGSIGTFPFPAAAQAFTNFTLNNSNGVTFGTQVNIKGTLTLTDGSISFPATTLTLSGTFAASGSGNLSPSSSSTLAIGGTGAFGTLRINATNNTVGTFNFARGGSGTATLTTTLNVATAFNLTNGTLTNSGVQMANGSTLTRDSNGTLVGAPIDAGQTYNVVYTGSTVTTGPELPTTVTDMLRDLTINGGPVTLSQNIIVHGNVLLQSNMFDAGGFNITMSPATSSTWTKSSGTFVGGAGVLIIGGNVTVVASGTPNFTNITTNSGSTFTLPASNINIAGDLNLNSSGTFTATGTTLTFNGSGLQTITGGGKMFNNITVNKTGGVVDLLPSIDLAGVLDIQSATTVQANGNLRLISTSDGASGNASISKIATGGSVTGSVIVQRRISSEGNVYRDLSSPVQAATIAQLQASGLAVTGISGTSAPCPGCVGDNPSMYFYNEPTAGSFSNGYTAMTSSAQTLTPGKGYNTFVRSAAGAITPAFTGTINAGNFTYTVPALISFTNTQPNPDDGWNLIGNPYPSTIDWNTGWSKTGVQGNTIWIWDGPTSSYKSWNGSSGSLPNGRIATGQGFWFQASTTPALQVTENSKTSTTGIFYREKIEPVHHIEVIFAGPNNIEDRTYIQQIEGSSLAFDSNDGTKFPYDGFTIATVASDDKKRRLGINAVGQIVTSGEFPLVMNNPPVGEYTVSKNALGDFAGVAVSLRDNYQNATIDLSDGSPYKFIVSDNEGSKDANRFVLVFGEVNAANETSVVLYPNPVGDKANVRAISETKPSGIVLDNMGKALGALEWSQEAAGSKTWNSNFDISAQSAGIYLVKVEGSRGVDVVKFIKK
jgi:hypothetical protein